MKIIRRVGLSIESQFVQPMLLLAMFWMLLLTTAGQTAMVYVDSARGSNSYDGSTNIVLNSTTGPKPNITAGIVSATNGGTLVVESGFYQETNWDAGAKSLTIIPHGNVIIYDTDPWITDSDGDGLPDAWEMVYSLDPFNTNGINGATGDPDGDGVNNHDEYIAGTNPDLFDTAVPIIHPFGGTTRGPQRITITCTSSGAVIHYTIIDTRIIGCHTGHNSACA